MQCPSNHLGHSLSNDYYYYSDYLCTINVRTNCTLSHLHTDARTHAHTHLHLHTLLISIPSNHRQLLVVVDDDFMIETHKKCECTENKMKWNIIKTLSNRKLYEKFSQTDLKWDNHKKSENKMKWNANEWASSNKNESIAFFVWTMWTCERREKKIRFHSTQNYKWVITVKINIKIKLKMITIQMQID